MNHKYFIHHFLTQRMSFETNPAMTKRRATHINLWISDKL